jgi:hypothetical protein
MWRCFALAAGLRVVASTSRPTGRPATRTGWPRMRSRPPGATSNSIEARFRFRDGLIVGHVDRFDLWRWMASARMEGRIAGLAASAQRAANQASKALMSGRRIDRSRTRNADLRCARARPQGHPKGELPRSASAEARSMPAGRSKGPNCPKRKARRVIRDCLPRRAGLRTRSAAAGRRPSLNLGTPDAPTRQRYDATSPNSCRIAGCEIPRPLWKPILRLFAYAAGAIGKEITR